MLSRHFKEGPEKCHRMRLSSNSLIKFTRFLTKSSFYSLFLFKKTEQNIQVFNDVLNNLCTIVRHLQCRAAIIVVCYFPIWACQMVDMNLQHKNIDDI